jgi:hypothetical protein
MADQLRMLTHLAAQELLQMSATEGAHLHATRAQVPPLQRARVTQTRCLPAGHLLAVVETVEQQGARQVLQLCGCSLHQAFLSLQHIQLWQGLQASCSMHTR